MRLFPPSEKKCITLTKKEELFHELVILDNMGIGSTIKISGSYFVVMNILLRSNWSMDCFENYSTSFWSMRFETKHRKLKETTHSITSRKNITLTISMKQQLKYSYRPLAADTNLYTSSYSICITNLNKPFAICKKVNTQYFDKHFQALNAMSTQNLICISSTNLENIYPKHLCTIFNGLTFIPLKI
ncbi:hypothetical protein QTP88_007460 [Uroleucon formosanum]